MFDFSVYSEIAKWIGWPVVSAVLVLLISIVHFVYSQQIKILNEKNDQQQKELEAIRDYSPDQLVSRLRERHKLAMEELENLVEEKRLTEEQILLKQREMEEFKSEKNLIEQANRDKFEKMEALVAVLMHNYELTKKLAINKQIEMEAMMKQAYETVKGYRERLGEDIEA